MMSNAAPKKDLASYTSALPITIYAMMPISACATKLTATQQLTRCVAQKRVAAVPSNAQRGTCTESLMTKAIQFIASASHVKTSTTETLAVMRWADASIW
jgi:hypothetical protein